MGRLLSFAAVGLLTQQINVSEVARSLLDQDILPDPPPEVPVSWVWETATPPISGDAYRGPAPMLSPSAGSWRTAGSGVSGPGGVPARSTEEMVAWLVDRAEISDLLHSFARALDAKDWDAYAANFTEDGELVLPWGGHKGRAGLASYVGNDLSKFAATHHISANHQVTVDGDIATSRSYLQAVHVLDGADQTTHFDVGGWYDNEYRRTAEGWRISRVAITDVWKAGTDGS